MNHNLKVQSVAIDWPGKTMEITDTANKKHTIPLGQSITVTMVGYPDREVKTLLAGELGDYMSQGYIIESIQIEEGER